MGMRSRSLTSPVRLTSLQISMNWIRACSASARTRITTENSDSAEADTEESADSTEKEADSESK